MRDNPRSPNSNNNRNWQIIAGIVLMLMAFGGVGGFGYATLWFAIGAFLLYRQFQPQIRRWTGSSEAQSRANTNRYDYSYSDERTLLRRTENDYSFEDEPAEAAYSAPPRNRAATYTAPVAPATSPGTTRGTTPSRADTRTGDGVFYHALDAMRAANIDPVTTPVLPTDIGLMTIYPGGDPVVHRSTPVAENASYIQPFVNLRLKQRAVGRVRFEISDADDQILFVHEEVYQLKSGDNLLTPPARLRLHAAQNRRAGWHLRVSADGVPLADHAVLWEEDNSAVVRRHLTSDGEISGELRQMMAENRLGAERLSLDDLLADQHEAMEESRAANPQRRRS